MQFLKTTNLCKDERAALTVGAFFFALLGTVQVLRLITNFGITIGSFDVPYTVSIFAAIIAWTLATWFGFLAKQHAGQ
jgi:hypothetical protein